MGGDEMNKELIIPCCKCTLVLYENELFNGLNPEVLEQAIRKGKGYCRAMNVEKRQQKSDSEYENIFTK